MTREIDGRLKQMFSDLDEELPAADFTSEVVSALRKPGRRERWLWASAILAALVFLWVAFPVLVAGLNRVAGFPQALFDFAVESFAALSPLVFVYGTALGGYVLLWLVRRLQIRSM